MLKAAFKTMQNQNPTLFYFLSPMQNIKSRIPVWKLNMHANKSWIRQWNPHIEVYQAEIHTYQAEIHTHQADPSQERTQISEYSSVTQKATQNEP